LRATTRLAANPTSARAARRFVNEALRRARVHHVDDVVVLLANELVTNAIVHARSPVELTVELIQGGVRVEVSDTSPDSPTRRVAGRLATSGRGLELVETMATAWGVDQLSGKGKRVWFEVSL